MIIMILIRITLVGGVLVTNCLCYYDFFLKSKVNLERLVERYMNQSKSLLMNDHQ